MKIRLFHSLPLAALLLACPALAAPDTHEHHGHDAHAGHSHAEAHDGHDHAAHEGHSHAAGEACTAEHEGHDHAAREHKHDEGDHASCNGHDHEHEATAHGGHDHAAHEHKHDEGDHASCSGHDHEHEATAHDGHDHAAHEGHNHAAGEPCSGGHDHSHSASMPEVIIVTADPHSRHLIALQVEEVPAASGALSSSLYGTLTTPDHALQTYALPAAGRISLKVKSAQQVKEGEVLCTVESPALSEMVASLHQSEANLARCKDEIAALDARITRLAAVGTRNSDLEEQLTFKRAEERQLTRDWETGKSRLRMLAMGAELEEADGLPYLIIKATKAGTVRNVGVPQGSWGEQGATVITMSDPAAMEIEASLYANDMPEFNRVRALIPTGRENRATEGEWRLAEQVDKQKQTRTLYFAPEALPAGARPGQLCRLDLYNDNAACGNTISIPDSAIVRVGMDDMVFIELEPGRYAATKVHAGESRRGMTPVSGLHPGQRIVVKGGYELKYILPAQDGQKKKAAGHFHADGKFHEGEH